MSIARDLLKVHSLTLGEMARVDRDPFGTSLVLDETGKPEPRLFGKQTYPPEYPALETEEEEDFRFLRLLQAAAALSAEPYAPESFVDLDTFEEIRSRVEQHRNIVTTFMFPRDVFRDLVATCSQHIDPETDRERLLDGHVGTLLDVSLRTTPARRPEILPRGTILAVASKDALGTMFLRDGHNVAMALPDARCVAAAKRRI